MSAKSILVVGGAGYIGAHMVRLLQERGFLPVVFDNLSTGHAAFVPKNVPFEQGDLRGRKAIESFLRKHPVEAVMHFAALSIVPDSVKEPEKYYENNVTGCRYLLDAMAQTGIKRFIFSSTASVYGEPKEAELTEQSETCPLSPYGRTKLEVEAILKERAQKGTLEYAALRYFNAAGAHPSGEIGEWHHPETHLMPNVLKVASGEKNAITIFGDDYPTPDGTCIRDYIHVQDLCEAHLLALEGFQRGIKDEIFNLGSANGFSVKEVIEACEQVTGRNISKKTGPRRPGDPARLVASSAKAQKILGWKSRYTLHDIVETAWKWEQNAKTRYAASALK